MTMIYPHRIRLRGPWDYTPVARADGGPLPPAGRMTMPCRRGEAGLPGFAGTVRFHRRFHWPSALDPQERLWLTFGGIEGAAAVSLNGQPLGRHQGDDPFDLEATPHIQARNDLTVEVTADTPAGGLWGEVAVEVRRTAFLRDVRVDWLADVLRVTGQVAGVAVRPLELYVLVNDRTASYSTITPTPAGQAFSTSIERQEPGPVRVELIDGGVVWYHLEVGATE